MTAKQKPIFSNAQLAEIKQSYDDCCKDLEEGMKELRTYYKNKKAKVQPAG